MIKIDNKEFHFVEGMTVADALTLVGERIDFSLIVMVDGNVIPRGEFHKTYIADNSKLSVLRLISGG